MYQKICVSKIYVSRGMECEKIGECKKRQFGRKGLKRLKRWVIKSQEINYRYIIVIIARLEVYTLFLHASSFCFLLLSNLVSSFPSFLLLY